MDDQVKDFRVLVVDDEANLLKVMAAQLRKLGYEVLAETTGESAVKRLADGNVHCVITDLRLPGMDGMAILKWVRMNQPHVPVIIITAYGTVENAVDAIKHGAYDYLTKPVRRDELAKIVDKARRSFYQRMRGYLSEGDGVQIIGQSAAIKKVIKIVNRVADNPSTVLISGESGTGKELVARLLHERSSRRTNHFAAINCAAIPPELLESEMFGYEAGAFTGATKSKPGRMELADKGTLFLDEIGELPMHMQPKLLRALQEGAFMRVGGLKTIQVDVRLVAATNQDLRQMVQEGKFREDLFYRLNVVPIHIPPLRERKEDIPLLVRHMVEKFNRRLHKHVREVSPAALNALSRYNWPGNIRELENLVERLLLFADSDVVDLDDLPDDFFQNGPDEPVGPIALGQLPLRDAVRGVTERIERKYILAALRRTNNNVTRAAQLLMISRKTLQNKMKELGLRGDE